MSEPTIAPLHEPSWSILRIICHSEQKTLFRTGILSAAWAKAYPMLFDEKDLAMAVSQPEWHFWEWTAAIYLYHTFGYHCLMEQYQFKIQKRKQEVVKQLALPEDIIALLFVKRAGPQGPDLLVFEPDYSKWFFCEVKGPDDKVGLGQGQLFDQLRKSGHPVRIIKGELQKWRPSP